MPSLIPAGTLDFYLHASIPEIALVPLLPRLVPADGFECLADEPLGKDAPVRVADEIPERPVLEAIDVEPVVPHGGDHTARPRTGLPDRRQPWSTRLTKAGVSQRVRIFRDMTSSIDDSAGGSLGREALGLLRRLTRDAEADFRPNQLEAIERLVGRRERVLLVQRTGWGKSAVYFIATRMLRDRGSGPTLLVSPLLALMRNQIEAAQRMGVRAETINSTNQADWDLVLGRLAEGTVDLLLISPERLANQKFRTEVLPEVGRRSGLLVIDEAHCISDWGHDFRPDYRRITRVLGLLPAAVPVLCCTATANDRVTEDVAIQLGSGLPLVRGPLRRAGLRLHALDIPSQAERLTWLAEVLPKLGGTGIVYCLTIADTERVAGWLRSVGMNAVAYSGGTDSDERIETEQALLSNEVKAVVATSALGMGFDKPDLSFVIHYQSPGSPIAYYQQVGRAGRALDESWGILLRGTEDADIQDYFIRSAFPPPDLAERVVAFLEERAEPMSTGDLLASFNVRPTQMESLLKNLEVDGAVRARRQPLAADSWGLDVRPRSGRVGNRPAQGPSRGRCSTTSARTGVACNCSGSISTIRLGSRAGSATTAPVTASPSRSTRRPFRMRWITCAEPGEPLNPASRYRVGVGSQPTDGSSRGMRCRSGVTADGDASCGRASRNWGDSMTNSSALPGI